MDPLTQGVLGSLAPQSVLRKRKQLVYAGVLGFLAGMLPDADIFIRSDKDPLIYLEYHRQFTHSLVFIPVGGLIAALLLYPFFKKHLSFARAYLFTTLGYATHGLLDACTTYGTQLFWPFSDYRVAWNYISIVDPLFTLPLLAAILIAGWKKQVRWARLGVVYVFVYIGFGWYQHDRAVELGRQLAASRGHEPQRIEAKPTLANLVLWKVVYQQNETFYVDAVRVALSETVYPGQAVAKLNVERDFPDLDRTSTQYKDIQRFAWFSNDYLALHPHQSQVIGDIRYSLVPNEVDPLWGIRLTPEHPNQHVSFENFRKSVAEKRGQFIDMLFGRTQASATAEALDKK